MNSISLILVGLLSGGLVNWIAGILPVHREFTGPRCHACYAPRPAKAWLGLLALFSRSWHCQYCGRGRQVRLIIVELMSMVGALWLFQSGRGLLGFGASYFVLLTFLLIAIIDFEHRLIPHLISLPSILIVGVLASLDPSRGLNRTLYGGLAGFGVVLLLYLFGEVYSRWQARRRGKPLEEVAFGFGDVTLATLIGVSVGWPAVVLALMIGVLSAGAFSLGYILWMLTQGRYQPHLPIPYGPFLILGAALVFFGGSELFSSLLLN